MSAPSLSPSQLRLNQFLNTAGETGSWLLDKGGTVAIPAILGGIGGWLTGVGIGPGLVQGTASGALYSFVLSPLGSHISNSPVTGEGSISNNARGFWYTAGVIANFAIPIIIAVNFSNPILICTGRFLPPFLNDMIQPTGVELTFIRGVINNVAPAVTQWTIKLLRKEDPRR